MNRIPTQHFQPRFVSLSALWLVAAGLCLILTACQTTTTETSGGYTISEGKSDSILDSKLRKLRAEAEKYPKRDDLQYQIAGIQFQKADYTESAASLEKALEIAPEDAKYHYQLGRVYWLMREMDPAEQHFRQAVDLMPEGRFTGFHAALAVVLEAKKDLVGALEQFKKCIAIEPENPVFYYPAGAIHDIRGEKEEAIRCYREYLERGGTVYRKKVISLLYKLGVKVAEAPASEDGVGGESARRGGRLDPEREGGHGYFVDKKWISGEEFLPEDAKVVDDPRKLQSQTPATVPVVK